VGLEIDQLRQLKQLQEKNERLKKLVADPSLDERMLQDVLAKQL
jgi:putative transposase